MNFTLRNRFSWTFKVLKPMSFQGAPPPGPLLGELPLDPTRCPKNLLLLGMIMIVAYAGGSSLFCISQRVGHYFFSFDKGGGRVFLRGVLLVATSPPPPVEIMNGPLVATLCCVRFGPQLALGTVPEVSCYYCCVASINFIYRLNCKDACEFLLPNLDVKMEQLLHWHQHWRKRL